MAKKDNSMNEDYGQTFSEVDNPIEEVLPSRKPKVTSKQRADDAQAIIVDAVKQGVLDMNAVGNFLAKYDKNFQKLRNEVMNSGLYDSLTEINEVSINQFRA